MDAKSDAHSSLLAMLGMHTTASPSAINSPRVTLLCRPRRRPWGHRKSNCCLARRADVSDVILRLLDHLHRDHVGHQHRQRIGMYQMNSMLFGNEQQYWVQQPGHWE